MKNLISPENAQFFWAIISIVVVSTLLFLIFRVLFRLSNQKSNSAKKSQLVFILFSLATNLLCGCSQTENIQPININRMQNSEIEQVLVRPVSQHDLGKNALLFQNQIDADNYLNEFKRTITSNKSGDLTSEFNANDSLLVLSKISVSPGLLTALRSGNALVKDVKYAEPGSTTTNYQIIQTCVSYYNSTDGSYIGDICS